ncbi:MAG: AraC family transcriptional regulator [Chthoniobacter sp.]|uniref:helix-turn-helix transcriptional regulator n=1 Tax=Chthoniobacter sp. TaxID=2510640 RepID=UPI0032A5A6FC
MIASSHNPNCFESAAWRGIRGTWQQVYGSFPNEGVSVEWHDFETPTELNWAESFHDDSLELCLNLCGSGTITQRSRSLALGDFTIALYRGDGAELTAARSASGHHRFATVELSRDYLQKQLADCPREELHPVVKGFLENTRRGVSAAVQPMTGPQQTLPLLFCEPPVPKAAQPIWFQARVLELISQVCFRPEVEFFCSRQKRMARERVEKTKAVLAARLDQPLDLDAVARQVGCSSFYLSRTFSQEAGLTMAQYLRRIRMEKAAELLLTGRLNVTEVSLEVGYSSLGHFSKSFCEVIGCCPTLYPHARHLVMPRR